MTKAVETHPAPTQQQVQPFNQTQGDNNISIPTHPPIAPPQNKGSNNNTSYAKPTPDTAKRDENSLEERGGVKENIQGDCGGGEVAKVNEEDKTQRNADIIFATK